MSRNASLEHLAAAVRAPAADVPTLEAAAGHRALTEELALALLERRDLPGSVLEALGKNTAVARLRTVRWALIIHLRTPRHTSLPLLRHLYPFELMKIALVPQLAADLKRAAEEALITKCAGLSTGERLSLAKQGSARVAGALLRDPEPRVMEAALRNPRLTEEAVTRGLLHAESPPHLAPAVCHDARWRVRAEVRAAALRCEFTPLAFAIELARGLSAAQLDDLLRQSRLPDNVKAYLRDTAARAAQIAP